MTTTTTQDERNWALAAHIGCFLVIWSTLGLVVPLLVLLAKGSESPFVRRHAVESLNFQVNAFVYLVVLLLLSLALVGIPLLIAYSIFYAVCVILATLRASSGEVFRYPLTIRVVS